MKKIERNDNYRFNSDTTKKVINILQEIKNEVYYEDKYSNPLVSLNIGKIENTKNGIKISFSIRTNRSEIEQKLEDELDNIVIKYGIKERCSISSLKKIYNYIILILREI